MSNRNVRIRMGAALLFGLAIISVPFIVGGAKSQDVPQSEPQFQQLTHSVDGPDLFRAYCASCHGADAKGNGPAAAALKARVPDLTILAKGNKGQFPAALVRKMIVGDEAVASHGSREMPVWGPIFHQVEADVDKGHVRVENLVKYLESIQAISNSPAQGNYSSKASIMTPSPPSGAQLYKQRCASCHGNDLKGNGPAPPPFREWPPDLTTLTQRHGGEFPDAYVAEVLRNGAELPAHGPAEMPIWGVTFKASEHLDETQLALRINGLIEYIKSFQVE